MKYRKLPLLAALPAAVMAANVNASADVTVYGKVNVSLQQFTVEQDDGLNTPASTYDSVDEWDLVSNASRFGIKGKYDINDNLKAVYKLEYQAHVDDGDDGKGTSSELKQRNIYGGFSGNFGTLIAGNFDTPVKTSQGKVDLFNDLKLGDIGNVVVGENRAKNIVQYSTPEMSGVQVNVAFMPGEDTDSGCVGAVCDTSTDDGIADHISASVTYDSDMLWLALATDQDVDNQDILRLVGQVKAGPVTFGALVQTAEESDDGDADINGAADDGGLGDFIGGDLGDEDFMTHVMALPIYAGPTSDGLAVRATDQDAVVLSVKYKIGDVALKLQHATSETETNLITGDDVEAELTNIGVDYKLSKKSKVYAYYATGSYEWETVEEEADTMGAGFELKF